ncbi:MAG: tol-pal system protein YbgF [Burkholderiales bacterium]|nr:tol-pal system protein YbgF [Burkholderiales bacterium]
MKSEERKPAIGALALAGAALWCVLNAAPASAGLFDDEVARKQIVEQQKRSEELRQQNEALAARLGKVEETLKEPPKIQPVLELAGQIELLRQEINQLRGQIEVLGNNIEGTAKRQRDMYVDIDSRLRRLEQGGVAPSAMPPAAAAPGTVTPPATGTTTALASASAPPAAAGAPAAAVPAPAADGADVRMYEAAQNQRRIGNYRGAIVAFQSFITQYPKSELAPRAQYWIGDSYYNLRDFKSAITHQQKLVSSYPDSATVADALLNIASSQMELGDTATARKTLDGLVSRYPASEAAEKAKRRLATLK